MDEEDDAEFECGADEDDDCKDDDKDDDDEVETPAPGDDIEDCRCDEPCSGCSRRAGRDGGGRGAWSLARI